MKDDAINTALRAARASGGLGMLKVPHVHPKKLKMPPAAKYVKRLHTGPIHSSVSGRTDHLPMHVPTGSYVLPADIVSHFGEGNTNAGFKILKRAYGGAPYNTGSAPYGQHGGPYGMATGGAASDDDEDPGVPIVAAGGEWVIPPEHVRVDGGGDLDTGHKVLDDVVKRTRAELVKTLQKLPGPKRD